MPQVFEIAPSQGSTSSTLVALLIPIGLISLVCGAFFAYYAWTYTRVRFEVSPSGLRIRGSVYGRQIPLEQLNVRQARVINVNEEPGFGLSWRTNGVGLPFYSAGWFKLKNGQKVLAFVTNRNEVVYIPTASGYSVMLSVVNPEHFIAVLKQDREGALAH
jgi:hypothetical protein